MDPSATEFVKASATLYKTTPRCHRGRWEATKSGDSEYVVAVVQWGRARIQTGIFRKPRAAGASLDKGCTICQVWRGNDA